MAYCRLRQWKAAQTGAFSPCLKTGNARVIRRSEKGLLSRSGEVSGMLSPKTTLVFLSLLCAASGPVAAQTTSIYQDPKAPLEARVNDLFRKLTQEEKIRLLTGTGFTTAAIPRLGVPRMEMVDAGQGVRGGSGGTQGPATAFPSGVSMASTWDPKIVGRIGEAIGVETLNKGTGAEVLLGPAVNIQRSPLGGRNGEYFSEDPYLSARLGVDYILGLQSTGAAATVKHYLVNNQETDRFDVDVRVGERALREIYLPSFEAAVKEGHTWTVMSSYNQINGYKASANRYTLTEVLKKGWGFDGMVMSDWGGVQETVGPLTAGNDLEMPGREFMTPARVTAALEKGLVTQAEIDDSVHRILRTIIRVGLLNGKHTPNHALVNSLAHRRLTLEAATEGIVLLKNEGNILPLDDTKVRSVAVIGSSALHPQIGAEGSPHVTPLFSISPLDAIRKRAGGSVAVNYAPGDEEGAPIPESALRPTGATTGTGLSAEYFPGKNLEGKPLLVRTDKQIQFLWNGAPAPGVPANNFSVRWTGTLTPPVTGEYRLVLSADDGCRLFLDDKPLIDHWVDGAVSAQTATVDLVAGRAYKLRVEYYQAGGDAVARLNWTLPGKGAFADAVNAAKKSDVALVFVSTSGTEGEGKDRDSMALPNGQDALIRAVAAVNKKVIVVLNNGTPVLMNQWLEQVPGVIETWFPGQEGGNALAAILFGDSNPSGKLPTTLAIRREDYPDFGNFPGTNTHVDYKEGIYVGYRHFDKAKIAPYFPFGHGLSYTSFQYSGLKLSEASLTPQGKTTVSVKVTNTGKRAGAEVVQLYVHDPKPKVDKAIRELKGFQRVELAPGETKIVTLTLEPRALAYCDVPGKQWKADAGTYELQVGASSRDIRLKTPLRLASDFTEAIPFLEEQKPAFPAPGDLAADHPTTSSSVEKSGLEPNGATDGNNRTRWASKFSDNEWLAVDLGKPVTIRHVRLHWEAAYAASYSIQVSADGKTWTDAYTTQTGSGGMEEIKFTPVTVRWVRFWGIKRGTNNGYSLYSFEVFGP
jgi:beta-glucosidase